MAEYIESSHLQKSLSADQCVHSGREYVVSSSSSICTFVAKLTMGLGQVLEVQNESAKGVALEVEVGFPRTSSHLLPQCRILFGQTYEPTLIHHDRLYAHKGTPFLIGLLNA